MKRTEDEWRQEIEVTEKKGRGAMMTYTAKCPICGTTEEGHSMGNTAGRSSARGKIMSHILRDHADSVDQEPPRKLSA